MEELSPAMRLVEELRALQEWRRSNERPDGEEEELSPAMRLVEQLRALQAREEAAAPAPTPCRLNRKKRERSATGFRGKTTIPQWSPWSAAGGWSLAGLPWHECGRGNAFTPQIDRVRAVLTRDRWAWDMDFDAAAPAAPGWFHITPTSVTEAQAKLLVNRAGTYSNMDYYALLRNLDERRPESVHPREPCIWVSHVVYFWNISRGWCSAARCGEKFTDRGMIFTGEQGLNVGGDNSYSFSLERRHNDGLHQWWNIMGCIHAGCQIFTNSHPANSYSARRLPDPDDPPFPHVDVDEAGGPTGYWLDFHGGAPRPPFSTAPLNGSRARRQSTLLARVHRYMVAEGWEHSASCRSPGRHCDCPYGVKRAELIAASPPWK